MRQGILHGLIAVHDFFAQFFLAQSFYSCFWYIPHYDVSNGTSLMTSICSLQAFSVYCTKLDPMTVARQMKIACNVDGQRQFSNEEVLSSMQIQSFFSRRAKCKNSKAQSVSYKDYEAAENEEVLATLRSEVLQHIQPKHPVMYNLCDLVTSQKLSKLKISKLSEICRSFKLEVPALQGKGRALFVGALTAMVSECSCYRSTMSSVSP